MPKPFRPKPDPPIRADGRCARRGCKKQRPQAQKSSQIPRFAQRLAEDPFCSSECARIFHGVPIKAASREKAAT